ncbi:MAG: phosphate acyltransferase PlsX [Rikenellaceae bacterium]
MRIGIDAMGGDFAPSVVVEGAVMASKEVDDNFKIVLFGDEQRINEEFKRFPGSYNNIEIVHTSQVIEMADSPAHAFSQKPDSSIVVGFSHLKSGKIDAFASAGSTGAMMAGCMLVSRQIEGIMRPAIATVLKTTRGGEVMILDIGLNVDSKPEVLGQYGLIGSIYCSEVLGIENPRIALLNIGEEPEKGNSQSKATYAVMAEQADKYNFVGNVEAKYIFTGDKADVFVCDGYVGNTILKLCEGIFSCINESLHCETIVDSFNYEAEGGTPVLGVNNNVVIGHGCSSAIAIKNMLLQAQRGAKSSLVSTLKQAFAQK